MNKKQLIEILDYLEKAQEQEIRREYKDVGVTVTKINFSWLKNCVEKYQEEEDE